MRYLLTYVTDELVEVASRKLSTLYKMLVASGVNEKILKAVMAE